MTSSTCRAQGSSPLKPAGRRRLGYAAINGIGIGTGARTEPIAASKWHIGIVMVIWALIHHCREGSKIIIAGGKQTCKRKDVSHG